MTCPNTHFLLLLSPPSSLCAPRTSPPFALCAVPSHPDVEGISLAPRVPSRAPSLPLRHFLFFWPVSRGCGAALQCCRHDRRTVSPPLPPPLATSSTLPRAGATLPLLHRCSCNSNGRGRGGSNGRRTPSQRQRGNYEVVAAALVHLVVRGRDIGLPRSTLPVRYSFPASLMHYTRLSASALCRRPSPVRALRFSLGVSIVSASLVVPPPPPPPLPHPFSTCLSTSLSICLPFHLFSLVHLVPAGLPVARCFSLVPFVSVSLSLSISQRGCDE